MAISKPIEIRMGSLLPEVDAAWASTKTNVSQ